MVTRTIEFPTRTDERLRQKADQIGKPAESLVVDAVEAMLAEPESEAVQPKPRAVAVVSDGGIDASRLDEWLAENWFED